MFSAWGYKSYVESTHPQLLSWLLWKVNIFILILIIFTGTTSQNLRILVFLSILDDFLFLFLLLYLLILRLLQFLPTLPVFFSLSLASTSSQKQLLYIYYVYLSIFIQYSDSTSHIIHVCSPGAIMILYLTKIVLNISHIKHSRSFSLFYIYIIYMVHILLPY